MPQTDPIVTQKRQELYNFMTGNGFMDMGFGTFSQNLDDPYKVQELHYFMKGNGFMDIDLDTFARNVGNKTLMGGKVHSEMQQAVGERQAEFAKAIEEDTAYGKEFGPGSGTVKRRETEQYLQKELEASPLTPQEQKAVKPAKDHRQKRNELYYFLKGNGVLDISKEDFDEGMYNPQFQKQVYNGMLALGVDLDEGDYIKHVNPSGMFGPDIEQHTFTLDRAPVVGNRELTFEELQKLERQGELEDEFQQDAASIRKVYKEQMDEILDNGIGRFRTASGALLKPIFNVPADVLQGIGIGSKKLTDKLGSIGGPDTGAKLDEYFTYAIGSDIRDAVDKIFRGNPKYSDEFITSTLPQGFGSVFAIAGASGSSVLSRSVKKLVGKRSAKAVTKKALAEGAENVARKTGLGLTTTVGQLTSPRGLVAGTMMGVPEYHAAIEAGATEEEAFDVFLLNYMIGQTDGLVIAQTLAAANKASGGVFSRMLKGMSVGGPREMIQEGTQEMLTNLTAQEYYDKTRDVLYGVAESAGAGFVIGTLLGGAAGMAQVNPQSEWQEVYDRLKYESEVVLEDEVIAEQSKRFEKQTMEELSARFKEEIIPGGIEKGITEDLDPALNAEIEAAAVAVEQELGKEEQQAEEVQTIKNTLVTRKIKKMATDSRDIIKEQRKGGEPLGKLMEVSSEKAVATNDPIKIGKNTATTSFYENGTIVEVTDKKGNKASFVYDSDMNPIGSPQYRLKAGNTLEKVFKGVTHSELLNKLSKQAAPAKTGPMSSLLQKVIPPNLFRQFNEEFDNKESRSTYKEPHAMKVARASYIRRRFNDVIKASSGLSVENKALREVGGDMVDWFKSNKTLIDKSSMSTPHKEQIRKLSKVNAQSLGVLSDTELKTFTTGLLDMLYTGSFNKELASTVDKARGEVIVKEFNEGTKGIKLDRMKTWLERGLEPVTRSSMTRSTSSLATAFSDFVPKVANKLKDIIYSPVERVTTQINRKMYDRNNGYVVRISKLINKHDLFEKDDVTVGMFGHILNTKVNPEEDLQKWRDEIREKIDRLRDSMETLVGVKRKRVNLTKPQRRIANVYKSRDLPVLDELEAKIMNAVGTSALMEGGLTFDEVGDQIAKRVLTRGQYAYYTELRNIQKEIEPDVVDNYHLYHGDKFPFRYNYFPSNSVGRLPNLSPEQIEEQGPVTLAEKQEANTKMIEGVIGSDGNIPKSVKTQSQHTLYAGNPAGTLYDFSAISTVTNYMRDVLFDVYASPAIGELRNVMKNKDFRGRWTEDDLTNIQKSIREKLLNAKGRAYYSPRVVKLLEEMKRRIVKGTLDSVRQFPIQLFPQIVGQIALTPKDITGSAAKMLKSMFTDQTVDIGGTKVPLDQFINDFNNLPFRDIFLDIEDTKRTSLPKRKIIGEITKWVNKMEEYNATPMVAADKLAAAITGLAEFRRLGGHKAKYGSKEYREAIVGADRMTDVFQNVSVREMGPDIFNPSSASGRVIASVFFTFKSFALNQTINSLNALGVLLNPYTSWNAKGWAGRTLVAHGVSNYGYYLLSAWLRLAYENLAEEIFGDDGEEDETRIKEFMNQTTLLANTAYDLAIGGAPDVADNLLRFYLFEINKKHGIFDKYPLFLSYRRDRVGQTVDAVGGGYAEPIMFGLEVANQMLGLSETNIEDDSFKWMFAGEAMRYLKGFPLRGDVKRLIDQKVKQERRKEKAKKEAAKYY